jgi:hypothetical protein
MTPQTLRVAYADPPYPNQSKKHYGDHPDYDGEVDHMQLIHRLETSGYDGWALSTSAPGLQHVLDSCRVMGLDSLKGDFRVLAWPKTFGAFKRNVRVAYVWEPIILRPPPRLDGSVPTRDWFAEPITMKRGLSGAKPERLCFWLFNVLGLRACDTLDDLYPGSGAVMRAWESFCEQGAPKMKQSLKVAYSLEVAA